MKTALIIGAGVTGLCTAWHLARMRYGRVIVLDKGGVGDGSSSRAAGISSGLLWTETGVRARRHSLRIFRELSRELPGYTFHNEHGCLNLFNPALWPAREKLLPLYDRLEAPYQIMDAAEIRRRWPALNPDPDFLGLHDPLGGYSEPAEFLAALTRRVRELGVEIRESACVEALVTAGGRVTGVRLADGPLAAEAVVAANYAWILPLLATAGVRLPAKTFVHQRYVSAPLERPLVIPPVNADPFGGYVRPAAGGRLLLGVETPERDDFKVPGFGFRLGELAAPAGLLQATVERFRRFVPGIERLRWESTHVGLLSFSVDGEPIVGPVPGIDGLFVGICFHSGGFSYSPASGLFLARMVAGEPLPIDLTAFAPSRFARDETDRYLAATISQQQSFRRRH
ncbi:MAG: FAD-binding oxidoreductase [Opitutaceae bacterium]|nr:FAD-binding oxidoreductase [Opitutaceae bacterium]